jgi:WD40 repeat protein
MPLHQAIDQYFSLDEIQSLCFDLGLEYENLPGDIRSTKARELVVALERRGRKAELLEKLQRVRPNIDWLAFQPAEPQAEPPFKGLRYYDEQDAPLFFGREQVTAELVDHLRQHRFLAVVGASGSGKSSVVRAGVVPAVRQGAIEQNGQSSRDWPVHIITPGDEPLKALAATLTRDNESVTAMKTLLADLQAGGDSLELWLYRQMANHPGGRLLLVIDQFEELFTQCRDAEARRLFVENLVAAAKDGQQGRLSLILTLRADFYAFAVQLEPLRPLLETRQKIIGAMTPDELRQAIQKPAEAGDWHFQPGLVDTMLADVGAEAGSLPLLSHALLETWQRRQGRVMTLAGYHEAGGVRRAITRTADTVYQQLDPAQQAIARRIFLRLTELGEGTEDTRRRAHLTELLPQGETAEAVRLVLTRLADARLVTTEEESAEVTHEALIREWPALRQWLDDDREWLRLHRQLIEDVREWEAAGRDVDLLYRGAKLAQASEWVEQRDEELNDLEREFVQASLVERDRATVEREAQQQRELAAAQQLAEAQQRRVTAVRRAAAGLAVLFVLALIAAWAAVNRSQLAENRALEADQARATAAYNEQLANTRAQIAQSHALAAAAQAVGHNDDMRSLLLAIQAGRVYSTSLAYTAINQQLPFMARPLIILPHGGSIEGGQWNRDSSRIMTWSSDGVVKLWDVGSGEIILTLPFTDAEHGVQLSGEGNRILAWSNTTAEVWDAESGEELLTLSHQDFINGGQWNEDDSQILTWSDAGMVTVWDVQTGTAALIIKEEQIRGAQLSRDSSQILTWSSNGTARVWDVQSGQRRLNLTHGAIIYGGQWNGDDSQILTWSGDNLAKVWDVNSGEEVVSLRHDGEVWRGQWSEDESQILTLDEYWAAKAWDAHTGEELWSLHIEEQIGGGAWNSDGRQVLTWSSNGTANVWDVQSGNATLALAHNSQVLGGQWNRDGNQILTWSHELDMRVWDIQSNKGLLALANHGNVAGVQWNDEGSQILTWSLDGPINVWNLQSGSIALTLPHEGTVWGVQWNEDGSQILIGGRNNVTVWDIQTRDKLVSFDLEGGAVNGRWSRDGSQILTWNGDGTVKVWNVQRGELEMILTHAGGASAGEWSTDGGRILTWGADNIVKVWDVESEEVLLELKSEHLVIFGGKWKEDSSQILTWGNDGSDSTVQLWDVQNGNVILTLHHGDGLTGGQWNRDASRVLTWGWNGTVKVWDVQRGQLLMTLNHEGDINGGQWNGNGDQILTWSNDGTAKVWDAQSGEIRMTLAGDGSFVTVAQWNEDESRIVLGTESGRIQVYYTNMVELIEVACQFVTRNLTGEEWQLYFPSEAYRQTCPNLPVYPNVPQP